MTCSGNENAKNRRRKFTSSIVTAMTASGVFCAARVTTSSSADPEYADRDSAGANHHGRPSWMTRTPYARPSGMYPAATGAVIRRPSRIS